MGIEMAKTTKPASKRAYLKQSDVPSAPLAEALRMPQAIFDHYAGKPATPLQIAKALNVDPKGSQIRVLSGAAIAFGLLEGGAQASIISVTDLARRILRPKQDDEDIAGTAECGNVRIHRCPTEGQRFSYILCKGQRVRLRHFLCRRPTQGR